MVWYAIIGVCIIAAAIAGVYFYQKRRNPTQEASFPSEEVTDLVAADTDLAPVSDEEQGLVIQMEMIPPEEIPDESRLVEITDSKVLAHVDSLLPGLAQAGNAVNNAAQAVQENGEVLYRAIIPAGAKLTNSKAMEGAVRGFYRGADGIQGHANLVAVEAQKGTAVVANTAAAAMSVASMVVGQYYMTQINAELGAISDGISKISGFQDNEYRSRVFSLSRMLRRSQISKPRSLRTMNCVFQK